MINGKKKKYKMAKVEVIIDSNRSMPQLVINVVNLKVGGDRRKARL